MSDYKPEDELGWMVVFAVMAFIILFISSFLGAFE